MRKILTIFLLSTGFALAACNTIDGAGEDVESVGNAVENEVN